MIAVVCLATLAANAQVYVGGSLGFSNTSYDGESSASYKFMPEVGYVLDEEWAIGISLGYADVDDGAEKAFSVAPYARWTFLTMNKVSLFVDGQFEFAHTDSDAAGKINAWAIGVRPGFKVAVTDNLSLVSKVGVLGYTSAKPDKDGAKSTNTFGFDVDGSNISFGLFYNF